VRKGWNISTTAEGLSSADRIRRLTASYQEQYREQQKLGAPEIAQLAQSIIDAQHAYIQELERQIAEQNGALLTLRAMGVT
jgi:uncharacterized protein (DUF305 family)